MRDVIRRKIEFRAGRQAIKILINRHHKEWESILNKRIEIETKVEEDKK